MIDQTTQLDLCCPGCSTTFGWDRGGGRCPACARPVVRRQDDLFDVEGTNSPNFATILGWPEGFLDRARPFLASLDAGLSLPKEERDALEAAGLLDGEGRLTGLGAKVHYQLLEQGWQSEGDQLRSLLTGRTEFGPASRVLDVGCGAGQTLRFLGSPAPSLRVGLDNDLDVVALGHRLAAGEGQEIIFFRGSGERLPFRDGQFTHVICRVALNYMHQASVIRQMARVLQPGGFLCCRIEGLGYDLSLLRRARNARTVLVRLCDLALGMAHAVAGLQLTPGGRPFGNRAFATVRRAAKVLDQAGCDLIHAEPIAGGPRFFGFPTQTVFLARRRS
jgi:SAM-dependent methyltransferase